MKHRVFFSVSIALLFLMGSCQKEKPLIKNDTDRAGIKKTDFIPRTDSVVSISELKNWLRVNPFLDSLSILYQDSFSTTDAAQQARLQENFIKAQDLICVRIGLNGGYAEYLWILKNVGNPKNASVMDSLKLSAYK